MLNHMELLLRDTCISLPLLPQVAEELEHMEKDGVISKVTELTQWCAGMVVVPK